MIKTILAYYGAFCLLVTVGTLGLVCYLRYEDWTWRRKRRPIPDAGDGYIGSEGRE